MSVQDSTYYALTKIREAGPEAKDWATQDINFEIVSLILKAFEQHKHNGLAALTYPGFYTPPAAPVITVVGVAGTSVYSYQVVARGFVPNKMSVVTTITNGNATLTGSNYNTITWSAVPGAVSYDVLRVAGGVTQGVIASAVAGNTFNDTGVAASAYSNNAQPVLSEVTTGGILSPGTNVGVRLSYVNALGLETAASTEQVITLSPAATRPNPPNFISTAAASPGLPGGTYVYVMTKRKGTGETVVSDILNVSVPYDQTYSVTLGFNAINSYADGTDSLNIYRAAGLASNFQLVTTVTTASAATFTDTNSIPASAANVQPPNNTTFNATKSVGIDWTALNVSSSGASKLRVYVTRQTGIWSTSSLLQEVDLINAPVSSTTYLGSETLASGWPKNSTQIPSNPPPVSLGAETTGAINYVRFADVEPYTTYAGIAPTGDFGDWTKDAVLHAGSTGTPSTTLTGAASASDHYTGTQGYLVNLTTGAVTGTVDADIYPQGLTPNTSIGVSTLNSNFAIVSPNTYFYGAIAYKTSGGTQANLNVAFYKSDGTYLSTGTIASTASPTLNAWNTLNGTFAVPANAAYAGIYLQVQGFAGSTAYTIWTDTAMAVPNAAQNANLTFFTGSLFAAVVDAPANTGSLRTLGTGSLQAAPGNVSENTGWRSYFKRYANITASFAAGTYIMVPPLGDNVAPPVAGATSMHIAGISEFVRTSDIYVPSGRAIQWRLVAMGFGNSTAMVASGAYNITLQLNAPFTGGGSGNMTYSLGTNIGNSVILNPGTGTQFAGQVVGTSFSITNAVHHMITLTTAVAAQALAYMSVICDLQYRVV